MESFDFITEEDKNEISYKACVGLTALTGVAIGRIAGLQGIIVGGLAGAAIGLVSCKKLSPIIKNKLFSANQKLNDQEVVTALKIIKENHPQVSKKQALEILANVKTEIIKNPANYKFV